jgi:hypothetical protein
MTGLEHPVHFGTSKEESLKDRESSNLHPFWSKIRRFHLVVDYEGTVGPNGGILIRSVNAP